jgi:serine/threonine-protein kinase
MPIASVMDLVGVLAEHGLLEPRHLERLPRLQAHFPEPREFARELLRRGWLTLFQVNHVFKGRAGELVFGPYVFLDCLGEGGMGQVFKARRRGEEQVVAIKVVRKDKLERRNVLRRFEREVRAASQLNHPNVVRALEAGQIGDVNYFAMEYVAGIDLARHLEQGGPLPVPEACSYLRQAALGLQHAHEKGLVHRDVKPHNLMVTCPAAVGEVGVLKILDLGLALLTFPDAEGGALELTQKGFVMGSADYLAPEQSFNSHTVDHRADLYSLGCTFYHLLTGKVPFPGGTSMDKILRHRLNEPEPIVSHRRGIPPRVAEVIRRLMAKLPEKRFQHAAELADVMGDPAVIQQRPSAKKNRHGSRKPHAEADAVHSPSRRRPAAARAASSFPPEIRPVADVGRKKHLAIPGGLLRAFIQHSWLVAVCAVLGMLLLLVVAMSFRYSGN